MTPRIEWLETFLQIVDTGSLTRTGERIARSQSAVSLQLRHLEEAVGACLLERSGRRLALTPAGERLLPVARRAVDAARLAARVARETARRTVRAGVPEEYADGLVTGLLKDLSQRDPGLAVEVQCAASSVLQRRVQGGQLDLALALADEIDGPGEAVASDPVVWLQAPGLDVWRRRPLPVALFDHACSWRARAIEALDRAGIDFCIVFTSPSVAGVRAGIRAGFAVGALARSTAGGDLAMIEGAGAPPKLAAAKLVLLRGGCADAEAALFADVARRQISA